MEERDQSRRTHSGLRMYIIAFSFSEFCNKLLRELLFFHRRSERAPVIGTNTKQPREQPASQLKEYRHMSHGIWIQLTRVYKTSIYYPFLPITEERRLLQTSSLLRLLSKSRTSKKNYQLTENLNNR